MRALTLLLESTTLVSSHLHPSFDGIELYGDVVILEVVLVKSNNELLLLVDFLPVNPTQ